MGMEEGTLAAMGQIDAVLADLRSFAADLPAAAQILDDTTVRVARVINGTLAAGLGRPSRPGARAAMAARVRRLVDADLRDGDRGGQRLPLRVAQDADGSSFCSTGEVLEIDAPHRVRTTERM